jgi:hypothetical protein
LCSSDKIHSIAEDTLAGFAVNLRRYQVNVRLRSDQQSAHMADIAKPTTRFPMDESGASRGTDRLGPNGHAHNAESVDQLSTDLEDEKNGASWGTGLANEAERMMGWAHMGKMGA